MTTNTIWFLVLDNVGEKFNYLFVQFYNNDCNPGNQDSFKNALDRWLKLAKNKNLDILIGLPAAEGAAPTPPNLKGYRTPKELDTMYSVRISTVINKFVLRA